MALFRTHAGRGKPSAETAGDFGYLSSGAYYFDSACQTLRPQPVIDAVTEYYREYNACGGRVKYAWGEKVDAVVSNTRKKLLKLLDKSAKEFSVAFCLNTTAGVNLLLQQLPEGRYRRIVTSEIEHNSVFLPTQTCAKRFQLERIVLARRPDGSLDFQPDQLEKAVVVVNTTSNIDGRILKNAKDLAAEAHRRGGVVILDAAQTMGHEPGLLRDVEFDAICGSAHKMYGPSLGFIVIRNEFLRELDCYFLGGGTVADVRRDDFDLLDSPDEAFARLEPGLQDFAGIAGLDAALDWLERYRPEGQEAARHQNTLAQTFYDALSSNKRIRVTNAGPSPIISFYTEHIDAHRLALYLSAQNIMVRSGYFCCHYYLKGVAGLPPLLRISIGLNNIASQAVHVANVIQQIVNNL
ncbi:MAG TPA: aminotransferase class V-fold PLP-dependent enzyme [Bryobacteraceae bacterium]|jgi:selenocysteine lyase/cysteine desulfurase|nr:aminotransferase class V-fold PLP-dependent enzyme [Bryobacteraceae bacterium]